MGHINEERNLKPLIPLQNAGYQVVIVESSSTPRDSIGPMSLRKELLKTGIIILNGYIEHIEEIYQLSDIYVFPVVVKTGSIGMPLSILEARSCGIPVITTEFGSIKHFLDSDFGNIYYSNPKGFLKMTKKVLLDQQTNRQKTNTPNLNKKHIEIVNKVILNSKK
jgi:glycosyltransferase involved in cell wall biosynthesis